MAQAGAPAGAQESNRKTRLYCLDYFYYRQGDQATRLTQFLSSQTPLIGKRVRAFGVFAAGDGPARRPLWPSAVLRASRK